MCRIMIFTDWYPPAYKAGGPVQSVFLLSRQLVDAYSLRVVTRAYDIGEKTQLKGVKSDSWLPQEKGEEVYYDSLKPGRSARFIHLIRDFDPDVLYLNSLYSKKFTIDPIRAHRHLKHRSRIILAPRGMLKESALRIKFIKKFIFLKTIRWFNLQKNIEFHGTNVQEGEEIRKALGMVRVHIIENLAGELKTEPALIEKSKGWLNIVMVARVHPVKNLHFILSLLEKLDMPVRFSMVGNVEDVEYFQKCQTIISQLPANITCSLLGDMPHHKIARLLESHHLFVLPTLGENYGHAIIEALSVGRPVLISDQTPWRNLEENKAGWDLPLSDPDIWLEKINEAADWDQDSFDACCQGALDYAKAHTHTEELVEKYKEMFNGR